MIGAIVDIARKEFLENVLSLRYQVSSMLCLFLVAGSALLCVGGLRKELQLHAISEREREQRLSQGIPFSEFFSRPLPYQKRPSPVSVFASGLEPTMTRPLHLQRKWWGGGSLSAGPSPVEAPVFRLFTRPDLVYIVAVILSLLALITGYDTISREREGGTLKLLISCGVPRSAIILGKGLGGFVSVMLPLVSALLAAAFVEVVFSPLPLSGGDWVRLVWIAVVSGTYVSSFLFLGIFISTLVERSSTSLIVGLFAWTLLALIMPHLGPIIARKVEPVATPSEIAQEKRTYAAAQRPRLQEKYRAQGMRWWQIRNLVEKEIARETAGMDEKRRRALVRQLRLGRSLSRFSPAGAFIFATTEASGTGVWSYLRFVDEAERLAAGFDRTIEEAFRTGSHGGGGGRNVWEMEFTGNDLPRMQLEVLSPMEGIGQGIWEVFSLILYSILFCMGGFLAFMRADVD